MVNNIMDKEKKIKKLLNCYQNMSYRKICSLICDIFPKVDEINSSCTYEKDRNYKFYRVLKVNRNVIVDNSFFYERKKDIKKIKIERFNLKKELVLYLSESIPSTLIRECNLKQDDEIILVEYKLKEKLKLLNLGKFSIYRKLGIDNRIVDLIEKVVRQKKRIKKDYYLTNAIKDFLKHHTDYDGIYYLSTHQTTNRELRNVCLYKGVGEKKLEVVNVYRGTYLKLVDENEIIKNLFGIENFFTMKLEKVCSNFHKDELLWEDRDEMIIATMNNIIHFKI